MKKLTRKLFISILAAVFAVVALGTSTFAWITISNTASVKAFEGSVYAGESGIELSLDGVNYYPTLDLGTIKNFTSFKDITTSDGKSFTQGIIKKGAAYSTKEVTAATDKCFIEVTIHVRNSKKDAKETLEVYIENSKVEFKTTSGSGEFTPDVANMQPVKNILVSNAARLSFETGGSVVAIYEQQIGGNPTVVQEQPTNDGNTCGWTADGFAHKYLKEKKYTIEELPGAAANAHIYNQDTLKAGSSGQKLLCTLTNNVAQTFTIRVWVEGYDDECHHNILNQSLSTSFVLSSKAPAAE